MFAPALKVSMNGPQQAAVGDQVQFQVEITNTSDKVVANVTMTSIEKETGKSISVPEAAVAFERIVSNNISDLRVDARQGA